MVGDERSREKKPSRESFYSLRLKEWSRQIPLIKLSREWEKNILDLVPCELLKHHPRRVESILREIRDIYEHDMRHFALSSIVPGDELINDIAAQQQLKNFAEEQFVAFHMPKSFDMTRQRAMFANKYFLSHGIMRHIISTANSILPRVIIDLRDYRRINLFEMSELRDSLTRSVKRCRTIIANDYYDEIVRSMANNARSMRGFGSEKFYKLLNCATNLFSQQIVKIMMNTIDELIEQLADYRRQSCPRLSFKLVWSDDRVSIEPTIEQHGGNNIIDKVSGYVDTCNRMLLETFIRSHLGLNVDSYEVYNMWHSLIDGIKNIADHLPRFQDAILSTDATNERIRIILPDWYVKESHDRIDEIMGNVIGPLEHHYETIVEQFDAVTSDDLRKNITTLLSKRRNIDVYCINVKRLNKYYEKSNDIVDTLEYEIGVLSQSEAKTQLKDHIVGMRNLLVQKLLKNHREYNMDICKEFENLRNRMLDVPREAQALFQLSETISCASKVLVDELESRVKKSIDMLSSLITITSDMNEDHVRLNIRTINWLVDIQPIFVRSNTLCEAMKSELEDELQREINKLNTEIESVVPKFCILNDMDDATRVDEYAEHLSVLVDNLYELDRRIERINFEERLFKFPETTFASVEEIREILIPINTLNRLMCEWRRDSSVWLDGPFEYVNADRVYEKTINYNDEFTQLNTRLKTKIKLEMQTSFGSKPFKFSGVVDDPDPMQQPAPLKLCWQVIRDVEKFRIYLDLIVCMCNPALRERHWLEMSAIYNSGKEISAEKTIDDVITPNAGTTLRKLIALNLNDNIEKYQVISVGANKELALSRRLDNMIAQWEAVDFKIIDTDACAFRSSTNESTFPMRVPSNFRCLDEIHILMEEHFVAIREMKVSYFVKPIVMTLDSFSRSLVAVRDTIARWSSLQNEWFDFEPVFRSASLNNARAELRNSDETFRRVYETINNVKDRINDFPNFSTMAVESTNFLEILHDAAVKLEIVKEGVRNYLRRVRNYYPRFYFLSDAQVTRIVFEPLWARRIIILVNSCFTDIKSARLGDAPDSAGVVSIIDTNDETLSLLRTPLSRKISSPRHLEDVTLSMFIAVEDAIKQALRTSIFEVLHERKEEKSRYASCAFIVPIAAICETCVNWTGAMERAFLGHDPFAELSSHERQQSSLLCEMIDNLRGNLPRKRRKFLVALIIQARQQRDVTKLLMVGKNPPSRGDFNWKAQFRHYWRDDDVRVEMLDTVLTYGYEYSVCDEPMIVTPLTDRCYRSLMEAHRNRLYGVLFGPATSAKTRCIKSIARVLGVAIRILNCHERIKDRRYIENYLDGLTGCSPCWLCFENLDLLTIEVQSLLAQRITDTLMLHACYVSATASAIHPTKINSSSKLPHLTDSLKSLFRPVSMAIIDERRIVEIMLFAEGFGEASKLAEKIHLLVRHSIQEFATYDFSTRMIVRMVKTACALKNRYPNEAEESLIVRAILDVNLPKLKRSDVLVFRDIIDDLFPNVTLAPPNYDQLLSALQKVNSFDSSTGRFYIVKIIQMFETILAKHAVIVVGPSIAGKTSIIDHLAACLSFLDERWSTNDQEKDRQYEGTSASHCRQLPTVETMRIHHVALSTEELLGRYETNSSGRAYWKDGVLTRKLRSFGANVYPRKRRYWQWLVLDGPMDALFVDNLNALLDEDDRTLCLTSGEKIKMPDSSSIVIETMTIDESSPATISRCGTIYVDEDTIGIKDRSKCWIAENADVLPDENNRDNEAFGFRSFLESLLAWSLEACLNFVYENLRSSIGRLSCMTSKSHMTVSTLRMFEMFMRDALGHEKGSARSGIAESSYERVRWNVTQLYTWSQAALIMSIVWGVGGALDRQSRLILDEFIASLWRENNTIAHRCPQQDVMKQYELALPHDGYFHDHVYIWSGTGNWRHWSDVMKKDSGKWMTELFGGKIDLVPTFESLACSNILEIHVKHQKPFVIIGETAIGKTSCMRYLLKRKICQTTYHANFMTLGAIGSPDDRGKQAQRIFLAKLTKLRIGVYGPVESRLAVNFIDDLSLTNLSNTVNEAALELIRQHHDGRAWCDIDTGDEMRLSNVMFLAALNQDRGNEWRNSKNWHEPRFFRHFNICRLEAPTKESIFRIYTNILLASMRMNMFNADVSGSVNSIVKATIDVYTIVREKMPPIPSKFQYCFSLRDVTRIIDGCSLIHKDSVETKITLIKLWVHETMRVFADRIIDSDDADSLFCAVRESVKSHFKDAFETIFDNLPKNENDELTMDSFRHLIFSDFMHGDMNDGGGQSGQVVISPGKKRYEEIVCSLEALRNRAVAYLKSYNDTRENKLDILIFTGLLEHLLKISRVIGMPGGSLLMICFGGTGSRSLTALAAHVRNQRFRELSYRLSSDILTDSWRSDVKDACMSCIAGCIGGSSVLRDCAFFITDREIFGSSATGILADILSIMKTGQLTDLFDDTDREAIVDRARLLAQNGDRNLEISSESVLDYFHDKCREKVHFVLRVNYESAKHGGKIMNTISFGERGSNDDARTTIILNDILGHCHIECYESWPDEAFIGIAEKYMTSIEIDRETKTRAIEASKYFYDSVGNDWCVPRKSYRFTQRLHPAAYVHMVKLYGITMHNRQNEIRAERKRYLTGLEKLELAGDQVRQMQATLTSLKPQLEQSAEQASDMMKKIEKENTGVENATVQVIREEQVANRIAEVAGILKEECEADLAVAIPILEDAVAALNTLKPTDITLVKAMKNPPDTVKLVMAAVCVMLNVAPDRSVDPVTGKKSIDYWAPSKRILGDMNFLQNLKDYDKDNIPPSIMSVINKTYMTDENFRPHIVAKASSAAEGLCKWVRAMVSYDEIAKVVAPKKEKLVTAEKECNASIEYLNEKRNSLAALNDRLADLNVALEATLARKLQLENQVTNCKNKLAKAEGLIRSLGGEKSKWLEAEANLQLSYDCLAGDLLMSCGLVAFLGVKDTNDRDKCLVDWKTCLGDLGIVNSGDTYDFPRSLEMEWRLNDWHNCGLANNKLADGNAVIAKNSLFWPLFLDPQNQANLWIRKMERSNQLRIIKATNERWLGEIEACLGKDVPVLLENLEQSRYLETTAIDYLLLHLCRRDKCIFEKRDNSADGRKTATQSNFRLYMTSRVSLQEAAFEPHLYKLTSVINFTLADEALENRLLEIVVSRERPDLQDKYEKLTTESATNKRVLREEENKILSILSSSTVNIVGDEKAIETLDSSRNLSLEIMKREQLAKSTSREMNYIRDNYRPLANYCAALYDTLTSLTCLNHMYRFSLDWFTRLYIRSIDKSMKSVLLEKRLNYLKASFTETLHSSVRNALLDEHKLVYSFLLSVKTLLDSQQITRDEIAVLYETASLSMHKNVALDKSASIHLRQSMYALDIVAIGERLSTKLPSAFQDLPHSLRNDDAAWRDYRINNKVFSMPTPWNSKLTDFQRLILGSIIKPGITVTMIINIVERSLGTSLHSLTRYSIAYSFDESSCLIPLLFILPSYLDVYGVISRWAKKIGYSSPVTRFSMGACRNEASREVVARAIVDARRHGGWIILENCHLATDELLGDLEKICEILDPANTALTFRLWLTSYPCKRFPISVAQNSIKIHWEIPSDGVKEAFLRYYRSEPLDSTSFYNSCPGKDKIFAKLVYSMCFFHTVLRGREKFVRRGWNTSSYEFTELDLKISIGQLKIFLNETIQDIPKNLDALTYLLGECYYGGKILDPLDRRLVKTLLLDYCNADLVRATSNYILVTDHDEHRYTVPHRSEYHDFLKHIDTSMPYGDSPAEIFSLDENADTVRNERKTTDFLRSLSMLFIDESPPNESHNCSSEEERRRTLVQDIREKLLLGDETRCPDIVEARTKYPKSYKEPLNLLLIEEIQLYDNVVDLIHMSIVDIERTHNDGLAPLILTFETIDRIVDNFLDNKVPVEWIHITDENKQRRCIYEEQSLSAFIESLLRRRDFLRYWMKTGHTRSNFWLGGMVRCKKFISACRLTLSRKNGIALSYLDIDYEIPKGTESLAWDADDHFYRSDKVISSSVFNLSTATEVIHVHGLFLSGARWDNERSTLAESLPKVHWDRMPTIRLVPRYQAENTITNNNNSSVQSQNSRYLCPVKRSTEPNTNLNFFGSLNIDDIATIPLDSQDIPPEHWIKQTTTLFCNKYE